MRPVYLGFVVLVTLVCACECALLQLPTKQPCHADSECGAGSCCAKQIGPHILSRALHKIDPATVQGYCKAWLQKGEWCGGIWRQNGECGCEPSLTCHWYPPLTSTLGKKKRKLAPGNYLCAEK